MKETKLIILSKKSKKTFKYIFKIKLDVYKKANIFA